MNDYALITGGSQGLGKALAEELARRQINLFLVALQSPELEETAHSIRNTYQVKVETLGIDLTHDDAPAEILRFAQERRLAIKYLINNAGMGYTGRFESFDVSFFDTLIKLNMLALTKLTHLFLPILRSNAPAYLLNISSMAGLFTMPYKTVYSASKQYVYAFSRALNEELKGSGVSVTALCPGGILTNPKIIEDTLKIGKSAQILSSTPEYVAKAAIKAMFARRKVYVPKLSVRMYAWLRFLIPKAIQIRMIGNSLRKIYTS
jgi:short-subunit dehydrogenase